MGCNCKNVKKIQNLIPNANHIDTNKKGISKMFYKLINAMQNFMIRLTILILLIIAFPIVFLIIVFNLFFQGKPTVPMPKRIVEKLNKRKAKEKENNE